MIKATLIASTLVVITQANLAAQINPSRLQNDSESTSATSLGMQFAERFCRRFYSQNKRDEKTRLAIIEQIINEMDDLNRNFLYKVLNDPFLKFHFEMGGLDGAQAFCHEPIF
jgi:hypothetical protein